MSENDMSARSLIRRVWTKVTDGKTEVDLIAEAERITAHLLTNEQFVRIFARDFLPEAVMEVGERLHPATDNAVRLGSVVAAREALRAETEREARRGFTEFVKRGPKTYRLDVLDLTKRELLEKAEQRQGAAHKHARFAELYRQLAERMAEGQTVREAWSAEELRQKFAAIHVHIGTTEITPLRQAAD